MSLMKRGEGGCNQKREKGLRFSTKGTSSQKMGKKEAREPLSYDFRGEGGGKSTLPYLVKKECVNREK